MAEREPRPTPEQRAHAAGRREARLETQRLIQQHGLIERHSVMNQHGPMVGSLEATTDEGQT